MTAIPATQPQAMIDGGEIPAGPWLTRKQAAFWLSSRGCPISESHLRHLASNANAGGGPTFYRNGWRGVRYLEADLKAWRMKRLIRFE